MPHTLATVFFSQLGRRKVELAKCKPNNIGSIQIEIRVDSSTWQREGDISLDMKVLDLLHPIYFGKVFNRHVYVIHTDTFFFADNLLSLILLASFIHHFRNNFLLYSYSMAWFG